ncbi:hypothetical protein FACS1894137_13820 [Spirochaetia bacterium]|nr:hypothetical protein FACS1894137_13820 [Spirochaetia bacterium]
MEHNEKMVLAKERIVKTLQKARKKADYPIEREFVLVFSYLPIWLKLKLILPELIRRTLFDDVHLDLSGMNLTDEELAELFDGFFKKNKELRRITHIDLSDNTQLSKLPKRIKRCKRLKELNLKQTQCTVLPAWLRKLKAVEVKQDDA